MNLPLFLWRVSAGFPSPADDFVEQSLNLNDLLVPHPKTTYFARVSGDSMKQAGIRDGDIVVIDRAILPVHNTIILAALNGGFTVKRLYYHHNHTYLLPANPLFRPIRITRETQFEVWGVVTACIHFFL